MSVALFQSTPEVPSRPRISALATPTPMMEPMSVCDDDAGRPSHQVPRFQMMAAMSSANTMAKPAPDTDLQDELNRKQRDDAESHRARGQDDAEKIEEARPDDGNVCRHRMRVDHGRHRIGGVMEAVYELEAEGYQQSNAEQCEGQPAS